ncbi:16S rRNA (cytosine(967)-C(5))-methyltransferase RsmB [Nitrospinae bacterium AH-259-F20]|nr:16S rRNA (cytosine(967)-C(5))-methyltransferase RsmB [Nitrospinae bacterium AH-259-F20]
MSEPTESRRVAARILETLEMRGGFANELLQVVSDGTAEGGKKVAQHADRALTRELVYGVCRWRSRLDWALNQVSDRPVEALDVRLQTLLRLGAYQILELERIPPWAAVNESVMLAKAVGRGQAAGFINAVLRHLVRRQADLARPTFDDPIEALAVGQSHPRWLVERWVARFGLEVTASILEANNERAPLTLRVNSLKASRREVADALEAEGFEVRESSVIPGALRVESGPHEVTTTEVFRSGACTVQDEGAALVGALAAPETGSTVLDACAAPGGKATHMAEQMADDGVVVAMDRNEARMQRLVAHCRRAGLRSISPVVGDGLAPPLRTPVRLVLVDAPCSGFGVLRRHPEGKWLKGPEIIERHATLQEALLEALAPCVADRGVLLYSVCTFEPEETDELVARWMAGRAGWTVEPPEPYLPEAAHRWVTGEGALCILPERGGPDGFYAVRLRRGL